MLDYFQTIRSASCLMAILHLALPIGVLSAETNRAYSRGRTAVEEEQWGVATQMMAQAIDADPDERSRPLRGPYIPHFYLGLSIFELGDCKLAMQHLRTSLRYRVVQETRQLGKLDQIERSCSARLDELQRVRREIQSASQLADRLERSTEDPTLARFWSRGLPPPIVQFREARLALDRAEQLLEPQEQLRVSPDLTLEFRPLKDEQISDSSQIAAQVADLLERLEEAATEQDSEEVVAARQTLQDEVLELRLQVVRAWSSASLPASRRIGGGDWTGEFERVTRLYLGDGDVTVDELEDAKGQLANFLGDLEKLPPKRLPRHRAPTPLHRAAAAYFAGQYDQALALLEDVTFSGRQAQAHAYLFRAAALYSLYLIGDQPDPNLLSAAESNVESCLQASAGVEPLAEAFSPRFVRFFREQSSQEETTSMVARVPVSR